MPGPNGPSRSTVGGTTSQPAARDTAYAATSRPASVPVGKSHSGRSPATGLYTHAACSPSSRTVQYKVAFDAVTSLPSTSSVPLVSRSIARSSPMPPLPCAGRASSGLPPRCLPSVRLRPPAVRPLGAPVDGSVMTRPVPVLPRADVARLVERQPAEGARRPALRHDPHGALGERSGCLRREPHPQHARPVHRNVIGQRLHRRLRLFLRLDHHAVSLAVPGQRDGADPELFHQRKVERPVIGEPPRRRRPGRCRPGSPESLIKQHVQPLGKLAHLELLQRDAGDPAAVGCLQVEGPLTRLADRPCHEPLRRVVHVERHDPYPCASAVIASRAPAAGPASPPPPPTTPSLSARRPDSLCSRRMSPDTSPPVSFIRTRNGRSGVYLITVSEHGSAWIRWH